MNAAIGGSTNAVLHLLAIAYEGEIEMSVFEFGKICEGIPHLVPLIPAGSNTLLDFYEAGGIPVLMKELQEALWTQEKDLHRQNGSGSDRERSQSQKGCDPCHRKPCT